MMLIMTNLGGAKIKFRKGANYSCRNQLDISNARRMESAKKKTQINGCQSLLPKIPKVFYKRRFKSEEEGG
jgi:hypothetical protein